MPVFLRGAGFCRVHVAVAWVHVAVAWDLHVFADIRICIHVTRQNPPLHV